MAKALKKNAAAEATAPCGRFAAGEDPAKRGQIIDGAKRVFLRMGFDAASMNDITREAGVSKGTIYVYFKDKEDLFAAMVEAEREAFLAALRIILAKDDDMETSLYTFGIRFLERLTDEKSITAMRMVLGVRERMPDLCSRFFRGPQNLRTVLHEYLVRQVAKGSLVIDDIDLATGQYLDLASGSFFKFRLFGTMPEPPSQEEMVRVIRGAIRVFMAAYSRHDESVIARAPL
ncbi:TetR/AcrR family transcriptional regulator [Neorhizobium lilium]|uniref:TetR/AcrR family transcriptional regulator n=1 Tax=Neorhizobium lilium TaxID=2503024 RepID=A0A444LJH1_9HYPH|nr:TetR/AcrR family transcriptional regulator [Neorhizobium lilium]RWX79181.1 TetR/AcrR family transcriptional regulator [Neorhizobium lilium]